MKKLVFVLLLLSVFIIKIPNYQELNNIKIIDKIELNFNNNIYKLTIREIILKEVSEELLITIKSIFIKINI